jgi:hypothetical protein
MLEKVKKKMDNAHSKEFPRRYLAKDEKVLFETHPSRKLYFSKPFFFMIFVIIGVVVIWSGIGSLKTASESFNFIPLVIGGIFLILAVILYKLFFAIGLLFFVLFFSIFHGFNFSSIDDLNLDLMMLALLIGLIIGGVIAFIYVYHDWLFSRYALTDRRIIAQYGVFNKVYSYCYYDKIQSYSIVQSFLERRFRFGTLIFATSSEAGGTGLAGRGLSDNINANGAIVWRSIDKPFQTLLDLENMMEKKK